MPRLSAIVLLFIVGIASAEDAAAKKMLKELEGTYTPTAMTRAGEAAPADFLSTVTIVIKGDTMTVKFKKGDAGEDKAAIIVLDPAQKPMAIDMTPKDGPEAGKPMLGIVKADKNSVTLCWGDIAGKSARPKEFTSTKENKQFMIVMSKK